MKKLLTIALTSFALLATASLTSCGDKSITIGTMSQPGEPILEHIKDEFKQKTGYTLKIQIYSDFNTPNNALAAGEIDANLFQHKPFLDTYNTNNKTDLDVLTIMYDCAYGGYSKKVEKLSDIPEGKTITIANDASNMKRCLDILEAEGLIDVDYNGVATADLNPDNINDYIVANDKKLVISPISTALIPSSLDDKDTYLGIVNATFAINANLGKTSSLLCKEQDPEHVNANIVAVQSKDKNADWAIALNEILTSAATDAFVTKTFGETITPYHGK